MNGKELKRLSRRELVDIIYQFKKNEQEMQEEIETLKNELQDKRIRISAAGSIADAAVSITNVFSTAQMTADLYLREISYMKEKTEKECAKKIDETEKRVQEVLAEGRQKLDSLKLAYDNEFEKWTLLKSQIAVLEELSSHKLKEDITNG